MSPRVLFACWPFPGHVLPQISIASALARRGCEVAFYTGASAADHLAAEDIALDPFERVDEEAVTDGVHGLESGSGGGVGALRDLRSSMRAWLLDTLEDQIADLEPVLERRRPDVIVTDFSMWAPIVVLWEKTGIPVAVSSPMMFPLVPADDRPAGARARLRAALARAVTELAAAPVRREVDRIRGEHGLAPMGCSVNEFATRLPLHLVMGAPELDRGRREVPDGVHYVGACVWHPPETDGALELLDGVADDRPLVHVTETTVHAGDPFVLRAAAQGLADAPVEAVLTTGGDSDPQTLDLGPIAPNVHVTRWIGHRHLLPRCATVVTRGGAGTIMASLQAGVPLVIVPTTWDKPENARLVAAAGVGVVLEPAKCTPEGLRAAVEETLGDPSYRMNAQRIAAALRRAPGPAGAAELIERVAAPAAELPRRMEV